MRFFQGVDLTVAMAASWLPLAADYTRFSRSRRAAFWGTGVGYLVPLVLLFGLGALLALSRGLDDPTAIFTAIAAGGVGSAVALLALTVDEADEPFANVYSAAVSIQNLLPGGLAAAADRGRGRGGGRRARSSWTSSPTRRFLFLLGSCFVPLFGVLAADFLLGAGPSRRRPLGGARRLGGRLRPLPVDPADRARVVDGAARGRPREPAR